MTYSIKRNMNTLSQLPTTTTRSLEKISQEVKEIKSFTMNF